MGQEDVIARRYAKGLAELAAGRGVVDRVRRDLKVVADILDPAAGAAYVPEFARVLASPRVEPAEKIALAGSVADKAGLGEETASFLKVLIDHGRVGLAPRIARAFADLAGPLTGVYTATVHTAHPLTDDQRGRLAQALAETLGAEVAVHQRVDPGLIAGARVVVGDKTIDGSVLGRLERLKRGLTAPGALKPEAAPETQPRS